jgi:hypothetical protein
MFKKILYIGANDDLTPIKEFHHADLVFIDSLPRNEYGYTYYDRGFYRANFKKKIVDQLTALQFEKIDEKVYSDLYSEIIVPHLDPHKVSFQRGKQKLDYYFSTGIPENLYIEDKPHKDLLQAISECDTIFVKGHWPHESILDYIQPSVRMICAEGTYFPENRKDHDIATDTSSIFFRILEGTNHFSTYSYLSYSGHRQTFRNYKSFYQFYKKQKSCITNDE